MKLQLVNSRDGEKRKTRIEKAEELYILTDKWIKTLGTYTLNIIAVMKGDLTYNQCLDLQIKNGNEIEFNFSRIEMIIDIHFPELKQHYLKNLELRTELNKIAFQHKTEYKNGELDGEHHIKPFLVAQKKIEVAGEYFRNLVAETTRNA